MKITCVHLLTYILCDISNASSIVFHLSLYMWGRVTLGQGSPYHLGRVTLLVGLAVCLLKPCKSLTLGGGLSQSAHSNYGRPKYEVNNIAYHSGATFSVTQR